ncbi:MAG: peroxiredoxin, partial [Lachnospiraceae bacterium]
MDVPVPVETKIDFLYKEAVMSLINKEVGEFSVQGFH